MRPSRFLILCLLAGAMAQAQPAAVVEPPSAEPVPVAADAAPSRAPSTDMPIDMTPFQQAFDQEVAEAQAEATGATANLPAGTAGGNDSLTTLALRTLAVLLAICGSIVLMGWAARRWGGKTPILAGAGLAQVLGRVYLEPKVSLHFVKTGGRVIVVGVTSGTASLITEFEADQFEQAAGLSPAPEAPRLSEAQSGFMARLREQQERPVAAPAAGDDMDSLRGDIQRLKQFLQESRRGTDL